MATKLTGDQQDDSYSFNECKEIGKNFLDELKEAIKVEYLPDIGDPRVKATKYLEETEILQLLEVSFFYIYSSDLSFTHWPIQCLTTWKTFAEQALSCIGYL